MENKDMKNLPLVEFFIEDEKEGLLGNLKAVSVVTDPAIEKSFQLFNKNSVMSNFKVTNKDKMEITGPVMIPNKKILRYNEEADEYYNCFFSEETVKKCAEVYLKNNNHNKANFEHQDNYTESVHLLETWLVSHEQYDKSKALGFEGVKKGTWFATFKVSDAKLWAELKKSDFSGFSVEGDFLFAIENMEAVLLAKIESIADDEVMTKEEKKEAIKALLNQ